MAVRGVRPRLWLSGDGRRGMRPATLRARCLENQPAYARACRSAAPIPMQVFGQEPVRGAEHVAINLALRHLLFAEPELLDLLRMQVATLGMPPDDPGASDLRVQADRLRAVAVAYDWLYDALTVTDRAAMETTLRAWGNYYRRSEPADVFSAEAYLQASLVGLVGMALAGEPNVRDDAQVMVDYADRRWRVDLLPALGVARDWWHEGPASFFRYVAPSALYYAAAVATATDTDLFAYARTHDGDPLGQWSRYAAYVLRPDFRFATYGDATPAELSPQRRLRPVLDLLAWGTGDPLAQSMAEESTLRLPSGQDYNPPEAWHQLLFYDPTRPSTPPRAALPLAAHLSPTAGDAVVMRSSWDDEGAAYLTFTCGDFFSPRQHLEAGSLQLYRRAPLLVHTGNFDGFESPHWLQWYAQRSVHANTLAVVQPGEVFANARMMPGTNDGGQRTVPYWSSPRPTVAAWGAQRTTGAHYDTASVTAFETLRYHDYAACDLTRAYTSPGVVAPGATPKLREATRQLVYLRPELAVLFDRVEATSPAFPRRFMLHGLARPIVDLRDGFVFGRGSARVLGRTLLPTTPDRVVIEGFRVDDATYPPLNGGDEVSGARLEVSTQGEARSYFLHVLGFPVGASEALPPASLVEDGDRVGVRVADPSGARVYTVLFARTGPVGGEVRVTTSEGDDLYRGTLGAGGSFYAPVADAGPPPPDVPTPVDAGTGPLDAGIAVPPGPEGCGCHTVAPLQGPSWAFGLLGASWLLGARRRRRRAL